MESYICEIQHHSVMNCVWLKLGLLNRNKHHPLPSTTHTIFLWLAFSPHDDVLDRSWNETRENFAAKLINFISIQSHGFPLRPSAPPISIRLVQSGLGGYQRISNCDSDPCQLPIRQLRAPRRDALEEIRFLMTVHPAPAVRPSWLIIN